ncbi:hypothetical protein HYW68_02660, partial [Candidatus Parcubacteria bacterium]|nr:hypothetical protein [Candidatus Parcubacteria bacterium]
MGHLSGKKVGRRWYTTPAALARYQRTAIATAGAALAEPSAEHAPTSSFWKELREEFKALEVSFAIPKELQQFFAVIALVVGLLGVFDVPRFVQVSLTEGLEVGIQQARTQSAALGAAWLTAPHTGLDFAQAAGGMSIFAAQSVSGLLQENGAAVSASFQGADAAFRNVFSFAQPRLASTLAVVVLAGLAFALIGGVLYFTKQYAFAPAGVFRHLAQDRLRDAFIGLSLVTTLFLVMSGQLGGTRTALEELTQGKSIQGDIVGLESELAKLKDSLVAETPAQDQPSELSIPQTRIREITRETTKVEERIVERQVTVEPADLTVLRTSLASTASDVATLKGQLQGVTGTVTSHIVTITAPANLPTNKLLTLTAGLTVKGNAEIENLTVNGSTACTTANSACTGTATTATGWTDDGTVVRLTTATDSVGIGLTSPTSTLSILGSFAITPGGNVTDSFAVASTGQVSASSTVTASNFFTATASNLTTGDLFKWIVPTSGFTGNILTIQDNATTPNVLWRMGPTGNATTSGSLVVQGTNASSTLAGIFAVSSGDNQVTIGTGASSTGPTLLRFGLKGDTATDPSGENGQLYYNQALGKLRCYEGGSWQNCVITTLSTAGGWTDNGTVVSLETASDNVTLGGTSDIAKLGLIGDTDETQLRVRANATQSANLLEFQNSSSAFLTAFTGSGGLLMNVASTTALTLQNSGTPVFAFDTTNGLITASATASLAGSNFFTASASSLTTGDFMKWVVPSASGFTGDILKVQNDGLNNIFRLSNAGNILASSTVTTSNFFTASATSLTSGDLFRGVLGVGATADANFLSFSMGETPNNRRFALNSQGALSASSTVTGTNFFNVTATAITTGDLFKFTVPGAVSGAAWTGNILTVQNNTTSLNVTTPQTLLTISSTGSLTINNATTSMTVKGSVNDATNLAGPYSVFVSGRYAYVAAYDSDRLTVVDVSNPSSPTVVGNVTDATNLYGAISVFVSGRYAYLTSYLDDRLTVVDVSNPSSPTVVGSINDTTNLFSSSSVFVSGRYAYVTAELGNRL